MKRKGKRRESGKEGIKWKRTEEDGKGEGRRKGGKRMEAGRGGTVKGKEEGRSKSREE